MKLTAVARCRAAFLIFCLALLASFSQAQTIEFEPIPAGPYGRGSSISVLFKAKGVIPIGNVFELWLSDVNGNFSANLNYRIGTIRSHYTTFINGILPDTLVVGAGYKVKVIARSPNGNVFREAVNAQQFNIAAPTATRPLLSFQADLYSLKDSINSWVDCDGGVSSLQLNNINFTGRVQVKNEFDTIPMYQTAPANGNSTYNVVSNVNTTLTNLQAVHYRLTAIDTIGGITRTRSWFFINNKTTAPFSTQAATICYDSINPTPSEFKIDIDRTVTNNAPGAYYNFPGYLYEIDWSLGSNPIERFTIQDIDSRGGKIFHTYLSNSCGRDVTTNRKYYNTVGPSLTVLDVKPDCQSSVNVITTVQIFAKPYTQISGLEKICQGRPITFTNTSVNGAQAGNAGTGIGPQCTPPTITYTWSLDGIDQPNYSPTITFTNLSVGLHRITLKVSAPPNTLRCRPDSATKTFCVEAQPNPSFKFAGNQDSIIGCRPLAVAPNNLSVNPTSGCGGISYRWQVFTEAGFEIAPGSFYIITSGDSTTYEPTYRFDSSGRYRLRLTVRNSCDTISLSRWVNVSGSAGVSFGGNIQYCLPRLVDFSNAPHRPTYVLGTGNESYNWSVTPRNSIQRFGFAAGSSNTEPFPKINFQDTGLYTVSVTFLNACNQPSTRSQIIRFQDTVGVQITLGARDTFLCNNVRSFATNAVFYNNPYDTIHWRTVPNRMFSAPWLPSQTIAFSDADTSLLTRLIVRVEGRENTYPCPAKVDTLLIRFRPSNRFHPFPTNTALCSGETFAYTAGSSQAGSSYSFTSTAQGVSGNTASSTGASISDVLSTTNANAAGWVKYVFTNSKDGCDQKSDTLLVTVNPKPNNFLVTNTANEICNGGTTNLVLSSNVSPVRYTWTATGSSANVSGFSNSTSPQTAFAQQTLVNTGSQNETVTYNFTVQFGTGSAGCGGTTKTETVTVKPGASTANAGPDQVLCNANSFALAANTPTIGTGQWSILSPAGSTATLAASGQASTTLNNIAQNTEYRLLWTISASGTCGGSADTVRLISYAPIAVPPTLADSVVCNLAVSPAGFFIPLKAAPAAGSTILWSFATRPSGSTATIAQPDIFSTQFTPDLPGNYVVQYTISNPACTQQTGTRSYTLFRALQAGNISADVSLCQGENRAVVASAFTGSIRKWQLQDLNPSSAPWRDTAVTSGTLQLNNLQQSVRVRMVLQSDGFAAGCTDTLITPASTIIVDLPSLPGTASGDSTYCANTGNKTGTVQLAGHRGNVQWQQWNGSSWINISTATNATYNYSVAATTKFRAIVTNGTCAATTSNEVVITFVDGANGAQAGADQILCAANTTVLAATPAPAGFVGAWTLVQTNGSSASLANASVANTALNNLAVGDSVLLRWTLSGNPACPSASDDLLVRVRASIAATNAGPDQTLCGFVAGSTNSVQLAATPKQHSYETSAWTIISGTAATISNANNASSSLSFANPGTYELQWRIANDAPACTAVQDTVKIQVVTKPAIAGNIAPNAANVCAGNPATFSIAASAITGQIEKWQIKRPYNNPVWKDTAVTTATLNFPNLQDTLEVRLVLRSSDTLLCPSEVLYSVARVNVAPPSLPGVASGNDTLCAGTNTGTITLSGQVGTVVNWQQSSDSLTWTNIAGTAGTSYTYNNLVANTWYRAVVQSGVCTNVFSTPAKVTVYPQITTPNAGSDVVLCADTVFQLNASAPLGLETGRWTMISPVGNTAIIANPAAAQTSLRQMQANTTYVLRWTLSNGGICADKFDEVQITNTNVLFNQIDTSTVNICNGQTVFIAGQTPSGGQPPYQYQWQVQSAAGWVDIAGATQQNYNYNGDTVAILRRKISANPCENFSLQKIIYVQPPIGNNTVGGNAELCVNVQPSILTGSLPTGADGVFLYQWQSSPDSLTWTDIAGATQRDYQPPILTTTTFFRRIVTTTLCAGAQASASAGFRLNVRPAALAQWNVLDDTACAPFLINDNAVRPQIFPYENNLYRWFANGNFYGADTAINPGYTLVNAGDSVLIKMVTVSRFGCRNDSIQQWFFTFPKPVTSFEPSDTVKCGPTAISFTNTTPLINRFRYEWNFGNGIQSTAVQPLPVTYATNPNYGDTVYVVSLKAITECDTVETLRRIRIKSRPKALFAPDKTNGCSPMNVAFSNISKGLNVSFRWDFGDGSAPVFTNRPDTVRHSYSSGLVDTFYARLIASNECGNDTSTYAIVVAPRTVFLDVAINGNEATGCSPHAVRFINRSQGAAAFRWDFGDGNILNTTANVDTVTQVYQQAGTFRATVQATNNCSDTADVEIVRVFASPVAAFTGLPGTLCIGDTVRFTNQTDTATGYLWQFADGNTSTATNPVHYYTAAGTYPVKLISTRQYGTGNACRDTATQPVLVVPSLPGNFSSGGLISSCVPFTTNFSNQSLPAQTVRWTFGDGSTGTGNTVSHMYTRTGLFVVKMEALDPGGCTYVKEDTVRVNGPSGSWQYDAGFVCNAAPVRFQFNVQSTDSVRIDFGDGSPLLTTTQAIVYHSYPVSGNYIPRATLLFGPGGQCRYTLPQADTIKSDVVRAGFMLAQNSQCGSNSLQFTDTSRSGFGVQQWQWQFGDGQSSDQQNPLHVYVASNNYPVRFIATSTRSGCADTAFNTIPVNVKSIPVATIIAPATGCAYQPISFVAQVQSADTVSFHRWNFSNGLQLLTSSTIQSFAAGNYSTQLIVGTNQGCYDTVQTSFVVNPSPVTQASADQRICRGQATNLSASGASSLEWFPQDGSLSCITCANPIAKPNTTTQYIVTGTNNFGCQTRDTVLITVVQPLNVTVAGDDSICIGSSTRLVANGANTYQWSPGSGISSTTGQTVVANPAVTTRYQVIGFDAYNCFQDSAYVTVAVGLYPTVRFSSDTLRLNTGAGLRLNPSVTNGPIRSWVWTPAADLSCADCPSPLYTPMRNTCVTATATTAYGCSGADTLCITTFCQSAQVFIPNAFTPDGDGRNDLLIVRGTGINQVRSFRIFNRWGQVVFERSRFNVNDASNAWDGRVNGKPASPDVYVYTCEVVCENETTYTYKGNVTILQ